MGADSSRIIVDSCLVLSIFILPWWVTAFCVCGAFFILESFYEGLFLALIVDLVYFIPHESFYNLPIIFILFFSLFLLISFLKKRLRINY